ncbi:MAG: HAMP domain-containing protein [Planctomycetes bacterium]|nr:HAMP domain-containing protein [Planctomycetota bacterium]
MKFRTKLIFLVVGVIIIPILVTAMVGYLRWFISSSDPSLSPAGFFEIRRWILEDLPEEVKEGYSASLRSSLPPKPGVIVFDLEDRILVSNIPGYEAGTRINPEKLLKSMIVEEGVRIAFEPVSIDGQRAGTVLLKLPENMGKLSGWSTLHEHFITPLLALVIFSTVMVTVILNSLNRSIVYLERATKKITDGELDFELTIKGRDEISSLTRSFETMRRALKGELEKRSRFLMGCIP